MGLLAKLFGRTEVEPIKAHAVEVGAKAPLNRRVQRLWRLFTYLEQKGDVISDKKTAEVLREIKMQQHAIAAEGHPFCTTKAMLEETFDGCGNS